MVDGILKKKKKVIKFLLACLMIFSGCHANLEEENQMSTEPFTLQVFYSQTCPKCKKLRENFIPALQAQLGDQVTILEHDIDLQESVDLFYEYAGLYDWTSQQWSIEGKLKGVPIDALCNEDKTECGITYIPFVIVGEMYAFFGYDDEYMEEYVEDVLLALKGESLSDGYTKVGRFKFKTE